MRGVVAGNRGAVIGKLRGAQLIDLARGSASANARISSAHGYDGGAVGALDESAGVCGDGPGRPLARFVRGGFPASVGDIDGRTAGDVLRAIQIAIVEHQNFVRRGRGTERRADKNAPFLGVHSDPQGVPILPVDLVPRWLDFLRNFDGLAAAENIQTRAVRDQHPIFADAHTANGGRADFARNFRAGPERWLVGAVVLRGIKRVFFHKVEAFAELEGCAQGLAVIFGDAHQAIDAVVAFRILDTAGAHQRSVHRLRSGENFDAVNVKLAVLVRRAVGINAKKQIVRNGGDGRGQLRGELDVARGELRSSELQPNRIDSTGGAEKLDVQ